jgi:hypothetical protein
MRSAALLVLAVLTLYAGDSAQDKPSARDSTWAMRWRVWCDKDNGFAFRHPYEWWMPGMYDNALDRQRGQGGTVTTKEETVVVQGKTLTMVAPTRPRKESDLEHDVLVFSEEHGATGIDAIGDKHAKLPLVWEDWNYYRKDPFRPHADLKGGAPDGVTARFGVAGDRCVLAVRHGIRTSGLVMAGKPDREHTSKVFDTFEILPVPVKGKKNAAGTWRERQFRTGQVFDAEGKPMAPKGKYKPVRWTDGWEIETEHFHISGQTSPSRLLQHGAYYEALYKAYADVYEPERMPPVKFEVHIFDLAKDFVAGAGAWGIPVRMGGGSITGGFFVPSLLSLWVYEESGQLGGDDFSVEHVSAHECSHMFLHVACNGSDHVPTWINEGLAVYFESGKFKNGTFVTAAPRERIERLQAIYGDTKRMLMKPDWYLDHKGHIDALQYGEVYAMVHFWVFGAGKEGKTRFHAFWKALRGGEEGDKAFERIFMETMIKTQGGREAAIRAWETEMLSYVKKLKG